MKLTNNHNLLVLLSLPVCHEYSLFRSHFVIQDLAFEVRAVEKYAA